MKIESIVNTSIITMRVIQEFAHNRKRNENKGLIKYTIDKRVFIVNPLYRKSGENIGEILLKLMREDVKNP